MPSNSTLPEPSTQPQTTPATAPGSGQLERMQAEVQSLQQQAQATQQSLKKLQARESTEPYNAIASTLPEVLSSVDSTMLGVGSGLALASVIVWWYVWHRPSTRWIDAPPAAARKEPPVSTHTPLSERNVSLYAPSSTQPPSIAVHEDSLAWGPSTVPGDAAHPQESSQSPFARHEPNMEFDPEAAASEVTRVRKSLAEKREARAQLHDREDSVSALLDLDLDLEVDDIPTPADAETPSVLAWLDDQLASKAVVASAASTPASDLELDLDLDVAAPPPQAQITPPEPATAAEESVSFSLAEDEVLELESALEADPAAEPPREHLAQPEPDPESKLACEAEATREPEPQAESQLAHVPESTPLPNMENEFGLNPGTEPESGAKSYDFTITLALAQESATLELWNEARDLASEVLESDDPKLVSEALSLLERLNQMELESPADAPPWNGTR